MNNIGGNFSPGANQYLSNAQQVGLGAFVNTKSLKSAAEEDTALKRNYGEHSDISQAAQDQMQQNALQEEQQQQELDRQQDLKHADDRKADDKMANARQSGANVGVAEDPEAKRLRMKGKRAKLNPNPAISTQPKIDDATMHRLAKELNEADKDEIDAIEEENEIEDLDLRTPEEILEGVPEHAAAAAGKMVESQGVKKLAGLKQIPQESARELGSPELRPVEFLAVELEPALLSESEWLPLEPSPEEMEFMEQQVAEQAMAGKLSGGDEMLVADQAPPHVP
jgi:hypothetical protein